MKAEIRQRALELGFDDCRFTTTAAPASGPQLQRWLASQHHGEMGYLERNAHKRLDPKQVLTAAKSIITLAVSYHNPTKNNSETAANVKTSAQGVIARYARHEDYHHVIGEKLKALTEHVNALGGGESQSLWYVDTGPFLERDLAQRAGIGFVGKHTNLISRRLGNWIFLAEIITSLELEPDIAETNHCGTCSRCLAACPTNAITAPFQLDARKCISYLTIELKGSIPVPLRRAMGNRIYGCDDCLAVCPWNRFARAGAMMRSVAKPELTAPDLLPLLALDETGFKQKFTGTPLLRAKRRGLLRNVCVALGNVGDFSVLASLDRVSRDPEPLIAEHALWAIEEIVARTKGENSKQEHQSQN